MKWIDLSKSSLARDVKLINHVTRWRDAGDGSFMGVFINKSTYFYSLVLYLYV